MKAAAHWHATVAAALLLYKQTLEEPGCMEDMDTVHSAAAGIERIASAQPDLVLQAGKAVVQAYQAWDNSRRTSALVSQARLQSSLNASVAASPVCAGTSASLVSQCSVLPMLRTDLLNPSFFCIFLQREASFFQPASHLLFGPTCPFPVQCRTAVTTLAMGAYYPALTKFALSCRVSDGSTVRTLMPCPVHAVCAAQPSLMVTFSICDVDPAYRLMPLPSATAAPAPGGAASAQSCPCVREPLQLLRN